MSDTSIFAGLDGLLSLSRREGIDVRPTLLRVLTDLYVQKARHTLDEETQYVELATRLFGQVDDATRAVVRAKLSKYPATPASIAKLLQASTLPPELTLAIESTGIAPPLAPPDHTPAPDLGEEFFTSPTAARLAILRRLELAPTRPSMFPTSHRAARAVRALESAALQADADTFVAEVASALSLSPVTATRIVADRSGETLACAMRALDMPEDVFQRVLLFLYPARGTSIERVYRLSRFYSVLGADAAHSMITAWRGAKNAAPPRSKHQSTLYDDERHRSRAASPLERPVRASDAIRRAARAGIRS